MISVGAISLIVLMILNNKRAKKRYLKELTVLESPIQHLDEKVRVEDSISVAEPLPKSIRELLMEEKEINFILATTSNPYSPGLQYVKVYKNALEYPKIKGYIRMDRAAAFWGDVYYADDKRWKKYNCSLI